MRGDSSDSGSGGKSGNGPDEGSGNGSDDGAGAGDGSVHGAGDAALQTQLAKPQAAPVTRARPATGVADAAVDEQRLQRAVAGARAGNTEITMSLPLARPFSDADRPPSLPSIPTMRFAPGTVLAERYRIIHLLGRGGMGEVYRADDLKLDQPVALKFLPEKVEQEPDRLARLLDEVKIARAIAHPNLCRVYDVGEVDGHHFLSMEYVDGEDLGSLLRRIGRVPRDKAMQLGQQICHGLAAMHAQGIVHRDLKPANLMIDDQGHARIMDFGLASLSDSVVTSSIGFGTPAYMAPEQLAGESVSVHSDVYSLGLVLYLMFTGRMAFPHASLDQVWQRLEITPEPPSRFVDDIGPVVENAILRCLELEPEDRPESALEVAAALASAPAPAGDAVLKALLVCEPLGRAAWAEALGEEAAAALLRQHGQVARALLAEHGGHALAGTGGLHMLFDRPVHAVGYALAHHRALAALSEKRGVEVRARVVIHLAEVTLRHDSQAEAGRSLMAPHLDAQARDTALRLTALAAPGHTLLTRSAFDLARQSALDDQGDVRWLAHGSYEIDGLSEAVELFEVGVAGVAPLRAPQESRRGRRQMVQSTVSGWRPAPGLEMPQRPHWIIDRKLSEGGFGEVWLARHRKTQEPRVFKFCYDAASLRALEREITLFRLLKETLGERSDINRIFDWNFDEAPYFIESAYTAGGDLMAWAAEQGGLGRVPLETRLEIVAQVATALAAAHSVGVLHKDVKPANVLVSTEQGGRVQIKLSDFGIGLVTEKQRLADAGITVAGLTEPGDDTSAVTRLAGTRLYMAPELLEGKPATVRADVYALGVMLYQMVVGDFSRALAPGWERSVDDALLREDIAAAVDGSEQRLGDALRLADRLRRLAPRRAARAARERQLAEAEQAKEALARARRRRKVMALLLTVVTVFAGAMLFQSRRIASEARAAEQVSSFLVELFEVADPYAGAGAEITAREILDRGAARMDTELRDQPEIRARLMHIMGVVYGHLGLHDEAVSRLEQALATRRELHGPEHVQVAETQHALAAVLHGKHEFARAEELVRASLETRRALLGDEHLLVAESLTALADLLVSTQRLDDAERAARKAVDLRRQLLEAPHADIAASLQSLGSVLMIEGAYDDARDMFREAMDMYRQLRGDEALEVAEVMHLLAKVSLLEDDLAGAEDLFVRSLVIKQHALGDEHLLVAHGLSYLGEIARLQGEVPRAEALFERALGIYRASLAGERLPIAHIVHKLAQLAAARGDDARSEALCREALGIYRQLLEGGAPPIAAVHHDLGLALHAQGRYDEAETHYRRALEIYTRLSGEQHTDAVAVTTTLAGLMVDRGALDQARALLQELEAMRPPAPWHAHHIASVRGGYLAETGRGQEAEPLLTRGYQGLQAQGGDHARYARMALRRLVGFHEASATPEKAAPYRALLPR